MFFSNDWRFWRLMLLAEMASRRKGMDSTP
jgi:hypothetical protein